MTCVSKTLKSIGSCLKNISHLRQPNITLDNFAAYFKAVNNTDSIFYTPDEDVTHFYERHVKCELQVMFSELGLPITVDEILYAISQLSNGKASGPDRFF